MRTKTSISDPVCLLLSANHPKLGMGEWIDEWEGGRLAISHIGLCCNHREIALALFLKLEQGHWLTPLVVESTATGD